MQRDFHHTVIYVLSRLAGMKSRDAEVVAYCSQQVDDAVFDHALKFQNGGAFWQTRTAHRKLSPRIFRVGDAFKVWLPFHFLPRGGTKELSQALITSPEGRSLELLKEDLLLEPERPYNLHRLGIFLHVYADSFSHQDFKGYYDEHNDIILISGREQKNLRKRIRDKVLKTFSFLAPIGHGQALHNPDIPFVRWSYRRPKGPVIEVDNLTERFIPALDKIYSFLGEYLDHHPRFRSHNSVPLAGPVRDNMLKLLQVRKSSRARHRLWLKEIAANKFQLPGFNQRDTTLNYEPRAWFRKAVLAIDAGGLKDRLETSTYNFHYFRKRKNFASSSWVLFMRAAALHRDRVLNQILPGAGLDIT